MKSDEGSISSPLSLPPQAVLKFLCRYHLLTKHPHEGTGALQLCSPRSQMESAEDRDSAREQPRPSVTVRLLSCTVDLL